MTNRHNLSLFLLLTSLILAPLHASTLVPGVVVIDPLNLTVPEQNAALTELKAEGVHLIRVNLYPTPASVDFAKRAFDHGIRIDALIVTVSAKYAVRRPDPSAFPGMSQCYPLSAADPQLSRASFESLLQQLDAAGVTLAGLELDNEINWAQSNADFVLPGEGKILSLSKTCTTTPKAARSPKASRATSRSSVCSNRSATTPLATAIRPSSSPASTRPPPKAHAAPRPHASTPSASTPPSSSCAPSASTASSTPTAYTSTPPSPTRQPAA